MSKIDDLTQHSAKNFDELGQDDLHTTASKLDDETKDNGFEAINIKRIKRRMQGVIETPKPEPIDKNEAFLQSRKNKADFRKRRTHELDDFEPSEGLSYNTLGIFIRCN